MSAILQCNAVTKRFNGLIALSDVTMSMERGRVIGLLGPNGSGKTTLIKLINGLLTPDSGTLLINGKQPGPETKKIISYLPDRNYLNDSMKIKEQIGLFKDFYTNFNVEKAYEMLKRLDLDENRRLKTLSKGNKEKVQLILVMSREADLYCLDEPIGGVDPAARDYILNTIITNYNPNAAVVISTHLISDIETILDDVIFLQNGKVVRTQSVEDIRMSESKSVDTLFREVFKC